MSPREATFVAHALSLAALHGPGPWPRDGHPLPDEQPRKSGEFVIPSVVYDGISTHHFGTGSQPVAELTDRVIAHLDDPAALLDLFSGLQAVRLADDLVRELRSRPVPREKLHSAARFVTENATRREVAKLGIVLLGTCGDERDRELLQLLGTLDEFSLFAVVALMNTQPDAQRAVFQLAQRLDGWGRIHAVERLKGCVDPDIRAWLLRSGFRNGVMNEYLAHIAATTGGLYEALLEDDVDDALLDGAADILKALANGGPAQDMHDYDDAVPAMHRFAELLARAEPTLVRLDAALTLEHLVSGGDFDWPDGEPTRLRSRYASLVAQQRWRDLVTGELAPRAELADPVRPEGHAERPPRVFEVALSCGGRLGMQVLPQALARLRSDRHNAYVWQWTMRHADEVTVDQVVGLAEQLLPLEDLASGPSESLGLGPDYEADMALEIIVWNLRDRPGIGGGLLLVALANRVVRCRRASLTILGAWPQEARPPRARDWVAAAAERETNPELRQDMLAFLAT
ncbi:hypothetical protein IU459_35400 [Nocardia amamiensis]|uniref:HEAT repeat domain-containing protein n=1 Tax=Nocardia amamiensis TaxID=404578 RepID=A0ABS0D1R8_9NOCA|nr:hypothetical protein [Nocardia amamiensis]MBF6302782.1 hypothetical protein [Nocardia amamiensis]